MNNVRKIKMCGETEREESVQSKQVICRSNGQLWVSRKLLRGPRYKEQSVVREQNIIFNNKDVVGRRKHVKCFTKSIE